MYRNFPVSGNAFITEAEASLASEKYLMLLKDSVPDEDKTIPSKLPTFFPMQRPLTSNSPLPALAKEVLWYGHEKKFNESHNIPYSPFIARHQRLSAYIDKNEIHKIPPIPESPLTLWVEGDLQDAKHKKIASLVYNQIKEFENSHESNDQSIPRQFEGSNWLDESYDGAVIDYHEARKDQKELDDLRARAWKAGARWRHAELSD